MDLKYLLMRAYRRKAEEAAKERRKLEEKQRWNAAYEVVNPPDSDAKRYLNDEEYERFVIAARGAIRANMAKGQAYLDDIRAFDYRWWLGRINDRKEGGKQKAAAKSAAQEYNKQLNKEKERLKAILCPNRQDHTVYFKKQIKDPRYTGEDFTQFLPSEETRNFGNTIVNIGRKKLDQIIESAFRQFIDGEYFRSYYLLPSAKYGLEGVPCLDFIFDVYAVVEIRFWLKPGQKTFGDYLFNLPWREEQGHPVPLKQPEFLGHHYLMLTPQDLGHSFWQSVPLALLVWLFEAETKPPGITIARASGDSTTYRVQKFKDEVNIPDKFAGYLKNIGSIDGMVSMGIITKKVGSIAKSELCELKKECEPSTLEFKIRGKGTKKAKTFQLFSQGKGPSSPEVKALGLHKSTRFKYYSQYLTECKP